MTEIDFQTMLNGIKNDLKISIDDLFNVIEIIRNDVEKLKSNNNNAV